MSGNQDSEPKPTLSEEEITAIAKQVSKNLKAKHLGGIGKGLAQSLKPKDYLEIGRGLGKSWLILGSAFLGLILAYVGAYKAIPALFKDKAKKAFDAEITNQIKLQFAEPRISDIVVSVANTQASNLLQQAVQPTIAKFKADLANEFKSKAAQIDTLTVGSSLVLADGASMNSLSRKAGSVSLWEEDGSSNGWSFELKGKELLLVRFEGTNRFVRYNVNSTGLVTVPKIP